MTPTIDSVLLKIARLPRPHQIAFLRSMVELRKDHPRSIEFRVYQAALQNCMTKQIKKQNAADRRRTA